MEGGDLWDRVIKRSFDEIETRFVSKAILQAVKYLHSKKIAHRDLKPENVVFDHLGPDASPKLIDFGFAKKQDLTSLQSMLQTPLGTPDYVAPEVQTADTYGLAVDLWSVGCIVFFMLFRKPPFYGRSGDDQQEGRFEFPVSPHVSNEVKAFISNLLSTDPSKRMTAEDALKHQWFKNDSLTRSPANTTETLDLTLVERMRGDFATAYAEERETASHTKAKIQLRPARDSPLFQKRLKTPK